jgi:hypothetical protein
MSISIKRSFHLVNDRRRRGGFRVGLRRGEEPQPEEVANPRASIPRISRLMALAIHYQKILEKGVVVNASGLASLAGVTQPRMTQILNLNLLAPDIQEELLFGDHSFIAQSSVCEKKLRRLCSASDWQKQRERWASFLRENGSMPGKGA